MSDLTPDQNIWTKYSERKPETAGPYRWRMTSQSVKGLPVEFVAHMRTRWAGYKTVLSPDFDYWDGYRLLVPSDAEWATTEVQCKSHETVGLKLPSVELLPCPFCRVVPFWKGVQTPTYGGGVIIGAGPHQYNSWWLECCNWVKTPRLDDPRELAKRRNAVIKGETYV